MRKIDCRARWRSHISTLALSFVGLNASVIPSLAQQPVPAQLPLAFKDVTVIDVTDGKLHPGQTVVISGNRIQSVGPVRNARIPQDARIVEAKGKYLIPGLWDMHVHVDEKYKEYQRFIAYGVTGLREMAQRFPGGTDSFRIRQQEIMAGTLIGPRGIGPSVDIVIKPPDASRVMDSLKAAGIAFVKYHNRNGEPVAFFTMLREARRVGMPMVGHVPRKAGNIAASDSGYEVVHADENHDCRNLDATDEQCARMTQAYIKNGTWVTTTLILKRWGLGKDVGDYQSTDEEQRAGVRKMFEWYIRDQAAVEKMHRFGFRRWLAGTDAPAGLTAPGFSLLAELVLLTSAGLTPLEALQAATLHPAQSLHATDSLGTVAPGKLADLVLLDSNPLSDMRNIMGIRAVLANGRYFDRAALDALTSENVRQRTYVDTDPTVNAVIDSIRATNGAPQRSPSKASP